MYFGGNRNPPYPTLPDPLARGRRPVRATATADRLFRKRLVWLVNCLPGRVLPALTTGFGYDVAHSIPKARQDGLKYVLFKPFREEQVTRAVLDPVTTSGPAATVISGARPGGNVAMLVAGQSGVGTASPPARVARALRMGWAE